MVIGILKDLGLEMIQRGEEIFGVLIGRKFPNILKHINRSFK